MTKFLLHGGSTNLQVAGNNNFFREAVPDLNRKIKILIVYFARKIEDYPWMFEQDKHNFQTNSPRKNFKFEIANPLPKIFGQQIKHADVIYVRGGNTLPLVKVVKRLPEFKQLLKNKVYAGSSAGMYLVCKYYWSNDRKRIEQGLGILPIKAFAHWKPDQKNNLIKLKKFKENLPIYKVPEAKFVVIKKYN